jgi:Aerotolerance regulator N-terminal
VREVFCHRVTERHKGRTETNEEGGEDIAEGGGRLENAGVFIFTFPWLLGVVPVVAVVGGWGILRAGRRTVVVSSTRLWAGLLGEGAVRRRRVDWVLVMLLMAAILGGLALAGPGWRRGEVDRPSVRVQGSVRSTVRETQLFLQLKEPHRLPAQLSVEVSGENQPRSMAVGDLLEGQALTLAPADAYTVTVKAGEEPLGVLTFAKPVAPPFGLMTEVSVGRPIDPELYRVFAVQAGARVADPTVRPAVVLVDAVTLDVSKVGADSLVVLLADTPAPGIDLGGKIAFSGDGATPVAENLPAFVDLRHVRVRAARAATLSAEWKTLVSVEGHALVAVRRMGTEGPTICWVGANVSAETTWGADPSFVMCFAEVLGKTLPVGKAGMEWTSTVKGTVELQKEAPVDLTPKAGLAALGLIVVAMGMAVWRMVR